MELTPFTGRLGVAQGRLRRVDSMPGDGDYVFVLGDHEPGRTFDLASGDGVQVTQAVDVTGMAVVRARLVFRAPTNLPAGSTWEASIIVDGTKYARIQCPKAGRARVVSDIAANVSKLTGLHQIGVRLELVVSS